MKLGHKAREIVDSIIDELSRNGIYQFNLEQRRKHGAVLFTVDGVRKSITFSVSPSDGRAAANSRKYVRLAIQEAKDKSA